MEVVTYFYLKCESTRQVDKPLWALGIKGWSRFPVLRLAETKHGMVAFFRSRSLNASP